MYILKYLPAILGHFFPDYELHKVDADQVIKSSVQQTVHYDRRSGRHVIDILNIHVHPNRTVQIIDTRGTPPFQKLDFQHISDCTLETGMPGGSFSAFA